jgi:hypothetical protein
LRDRRGGTVKPLPLAVFRERLDEQPGLFDADDWGACGCLADTGEVIPTADPPPVVAWEYCHWEGRHIPVDHVCIGDARVPCERRDEDGRVCGTCSGCTGAQVADLTGREVSP